MNKKLIKNIILSSLTIFISVLIIYTVVKAGNIDSPADPSNDSGRMYTLQNVYDYLNSVDSVVPTKASGGFAEPSSAPGSTMQTLDTIFSKLTRMPATGQTTVYQANDDGTYQSGATLLYVDNGDGTITDSNTKLMWVKQPELIIPGATGVTSTNQIQAAKGNWATGTAYVKGDLVKAIELEAGATTASRSGTTVTASAPTFSSADIGREIFIGAATQGFVMAVTSSTVATVSLSGTTGSGVLSIKSFYVAAAAHTSGGTTFTADITANPTYWRETLWTGSAANLTSPSVMRWDTGAINNCENLNYAGYTDWRLPNIKELISIVNYQNMIWSIDTTAFPNTQSAGYWTSTTYSVGTTSAFLVYFIDGKPDAVAKTGAYNVRCVRG
jgi:hypothetical protein